MRNDIGPNGVEFTQPNYVAVEGDVAVIHIRRTSALEQPVSVRWTATPGSASPNDYLPHSGSVSFSSGETLKAVEIRIRADSVADGFETVDLSLLRPRGIETGAQQKAKLTILERP